MLKIAATRLIQHLISQNSWAKDTLQPFSGQSIQLDAGIFSSTLVVLEDGFLGIAGETNIPEAAISMSPSTLLRLMAKDEGAKTHIAISGDTHLATSIAQVFSQLKWDIEDDVSRIIGDIPAHLLTAFAQNTLNTAKETARNAGDMLSEYWQEEQPLIAKKRHVEAFNAEVDTLRADVARFEKKLNKLTKHVNNIVQTRSATQPSDLK
jgi:ubiquinone biosynthesis protein UbiJ